MKKHFIVIILIISFLSIRSYSCNNIYITQKQDINNIVNVERLLNCQNEHNLPQTFAVGAVGVGEVAAGFTLAEVLITLLIVGVVASLVIPGLIQDSQNAEFKTAFKKTYADLNQATSRILQDNGGSFKNVCEFSNTGCLRNLYLPYLSYTKLCEYGKNNGNCWTISTKWLNGNTYTDPECAGMILNNGVALRFYITSAGCSEPVGTSAAFIRCGGITIDTNGLKGPNMIGKDIFAVYVLYNQIKPFGFQGDGLINDCNTDPPSGVGSGCAARYLYQ